MNCLSCGKTIKNKAVEGSDYIRIPKGWHCIECAREKLTRWSEFERYEKLAEFEGKYREALIKVLTENVTPDHRGESSCMDTKKRCEASPDKCLGCWLLYLVGEEMEG